MCGKFNFKMMQICNNVTATCIFSCPSALFIYGGRLYVWVMTQNNTHISLLRIRFI